MTENVERFDTEIHQSECEHDPYEFDYHSMPTDISNQMHAAADHVRKRQRTVLIEIGRALLKGEGGRDRHRWKPVHDPPVTDCRHAKAGGDRRGAGAA